MTSYNEECLALIPGKTPKEKYEWVAKKVIEELEAKIKVQTEVRDNLITKLIIDIASDKV